MKQANVTLRPTARVDKEISPPTVAITVLQIAHLWHKFYGWIQSNLDYIFEWNTDQPLNGEELFRQYNFRT